MPEGCKVHVGRPPSTGRLCATFLVVLGHGYFSPVLQRVAPGSVWALL